MYLIFEGIIDPSTGRGFRIEVTQSDLEIIGYRILGNVEPIHLSETDSKGRLRRLNGVEIYRLKRLIQEQYVSGTVDKLCHIINRYGKEVGEDHGKVRIFPLIYNEQFGYQYLLPDRNSHGEIYAHALRNRPWLPKDPAYFKIDLNSPEGRSQLRHIVKILQSERMLFIIKDRNGEFDDGNMIGALSSFGFVNKEEIFSVQGDLSIDRFTNYAINIIEQLVDSSELNRLMRYWNPVLPPMTQGDFKEYINEFLS